MKKIVLFFLVAFLVNGLKAQKQIGKKAAEEYQLEKVLIFSRHGLRTPIEKDPEEMAKYSTYQWAKWEEPSGYLTPKGTILETYFGQYIGEWLKKKGLLTLGNCASGEGIFAYTNSIQRTVATGQAILSGGFSGCNVQLQHHGNIGHKDSIFQAIAHNVDDELKSSAKKNIDLNALQQRLAPNYALLSQVIDYSNSPKCLQEKECNLGNKKGEYSIENGKSVRITGSISMAKKIVSALLLAHYVGKPAKEIANGNIDTPEKWLAINEIKNEYYRILFKNNQTLAQNVTKPLLQFIQEKLKGSDKISILVGHDSNIVVLLSALGVEPYELENSLENIPIGGKLFFQVWKDKHTENRKFKLEYVYQTTDQLVNETKLTLNNPPKHTLLKLKNCKIDNNGFYEYEEFENILRRSINKD